ncbi:DUF4251 domain-containing protein [Mucilaginibacter terrigena]|uniref:DUF4251 domain-containing protein n=1 Tax=Mucilaginibacter terrigena TaxID=2492395 RepID=A0A4Q5LS92_9SPHI|nr:DUF4251 domain-containing protein [Mucilaginibacter terrigena]RYU92448.1 DUF4251 domain-containing protein [Mucilaginibacter terrigena]
MKTLIKIILAWALAIVMVAPANAQDKKAIKKAKKAAEVKELIDAQNYVFKATYMYPNGGGQRYLTTDYDVTVSRDTVESFLPYFGVVYAGAGYNSSSDNGVKFTSTKFNYTADLQKNGSYRIIIKPNDVTGTTQMFLDIFPNGNANLSVISLNRERIRYDGYIKERRKPKA